MLYLILFRHLRIVRKRTFTRVGPTLPSSTTMKPFKAIIRLSKWTHRKQMQYKVKPTFFYSNWYKFLTVSCHSLITSLISICITHLFLYMHVFCWTNVGYAVFAKEFKTKVAAFKFGYCSWTKTEVRMRTYQIVQMPNGHIQLKRVLASLWTFMIDSSYWILPEWESLGILEDFFRGQKKMATQHSVLGDVFTCKRVRNTILVSILMFSGSRNPIMMK